VVRNLISLLFLFNATAGSQLYPLSLHDALPISMLGKALNLKLERLPVSIRIVLESVLRNCDGRKVTEEHVRQLAAWQPNAKRTEDRKSTRLNSSHVEMSYAVFCLKKKKQ